jgi:hypothetical protein
MYGHKYVSTSNQLVYSSRISNDIALASQRTLLRNPIIPLVFRLIIWFFSLIALALGGSIFHISEKEGFSQRPSTLMAITVDIIALVYILYITYDEYTGKPLGLRSPKAKMRLILLDLFFIVFDSANLSLAFDALSDVRWSCKDADGLGGATPRNRPLCVRQGALSSVLLVALVAWIITFSISVLRYVIFYYFSRCFGTYSPDIGW